MKLKSLKPSMKENKRYLLLEGKFKREDVEEAIFDYIGVLGYAKANPVFISDKILAVNREMIDQVRGSFVMFSTKKDIKVKRVSGTISGLGKKK